MARHRPGDQASGSSPADRVNSFALALGTIRSLPEMYSAIHARLGELMDADVLIVSAYDPVTMLIEARCVIESGELQDVSVLPPIPLEADGRGTQSRVIREGRPLNLPDLLAAAAGADSQYVVDDDDTVTEMAVEDQATPPRSAVLAPLRIAGEVVGVIQLHSQRPNAYTEDDVDLLAALANVAAIALENARLLDDARDLAAQRLELAERLERQAQQIEDLLDAVPVGVVWLGHEGTLRHANPAARSMLAGLADVVDDRVVSIGGEPIERLLTPPPDGLWHRVDRDRQVIGVAGRPMQSPPDAPDWALVLRDLSTLDALQHRSEQHGRLAALGELAAGIAHDFNNLLAIVVLDAEAILATDEPDAAAIRERAETILDQALRGRDLTRQILDFGRQSVLAVVPLELGAFIEDVANTLRRLIPESVEIVTDTGAEPCWVAADPARLQQVVFNLCINARDAMPDGGRLSIDLTHRTDPGEVRLDFSDTGVGIGPDALDHVFDPFFTTRREEGGTGLGLAQAFGLAQLHGGRLEVASEVGVGSTFTLVLPRREADAIETVAEPGVPRSGRSASVLVVEDDDVLRSLIVETLRRLGHRPVATRNGEDAWARLADEPTSRFDVIVTDVVMPRLDGVGLHDRVRASGGPPVVFITGNASGLQHLADDAIIVSKPLRPAELNAAIADAIDRRLASPAESTPTGP